MRSVQEVVFGITRDLNAFQIEPLVGANVTADQFGVGDRHIAGHCFGSAVSPPFAVENVIASPSRQRVVTKTGLERVVPQTSAQRIVVAAACQRVVAGTSQQSDVDRR